MFIRRGLADHKIRVSFSLNFFFYKVCLSCYLL